MPFLFRSEVEKKQNRIVCREGWVWGCLNRFRQTNLDRKRDQIHQNAPRQKSRFGRQVDPQVDSRVHPLGAGRL